MEILAFIGILVILGYLFDWAFKEAVREIRDIWKEK